MKLLPLSEMAVLGRPNLLVHSRKALQQSALDAFLIGKHSVQRLVLQKTLNKGERIYQDYFGDYFSEGYFEVYFEKVHFGLRILDY